MFSETFLSLLMAAAILLGAFISAPVWLDLAQRHSRRRVLGGTSLLLGTGLSLWTLAALPTQAQSTDDLEQSLIIDESQLNELDKSLIAEPPVLEAPVAPVIDGESPAPEPLDVPLNLPVENVEEAPPVASSAERPAWVEAAPVLDGDWHRISVRSEFHASEDDARQALEEALIQKTREYVADRLGSANAPMFFSFSREEIKARFTKPDKVFHEVRKFSFGPMHQYHTVLEFPRDFRQQLQERWSQVKAAGNLVKIGGGTVGVILLLVIVFGYFRVDTATRGYYTSRLQFLVALAILALIVGGLVFARSTMVWVQWLL